MSRPRCSYCGERHEWSRTGRMCTAESPIVAAPSHPAAERPAVAATSHQRAEAPTADALPSPVVRPGAALEAA